MTCKRSLDRLMGLSRVPTGGDRGTGTEGEQGRQRRTGKGPHGPHAGPPVEPRHRATCSVWLTLITDMNDRFNITTFTPVTDGPELGFGLPFPVEILCAYVCLRACVHAQVCVGCTCMHVTCICKRIPC